MTVNRILLGLSSFVVLTAVSTANAQSLPAEGPLSVTFTATQVGPMKPMPIGDGKELVLIDWPMTASNDAGNPILNKMGGRCHFSRIIDTATKKSEQHGHCTYADPAQFYSYRRMTQRGEPDYGRHINAIALAD